MLLCFCGRVVRLEARFKASRPDHQFEKTVCIVSEVVEPVAARIIVSGRVQGVGFRFFAVDVAEELGITGWVKNLKDGRVEVEAHGRKEMVELMVARLRQGPPGASVSDVNVTWLPKQDQTENPSEFQILR